MKLSIFVSGCRVVCSPRVPRADLLEVVPPTDLAHHFAYIPFHTTQHQASEDRDKSNVAHNDRPPSMCEFVLLPYSAVHFGWCAGGHS